MFRFFLYLCAVKRSLTILIILLFSAPIKLQAERPVLAFGDGERLEFTVSYRARMWPNTVVGDITLSVLEQQGLFTIVGRGRSRSFFRWFFDVNDTYTIVMDAETLRPLTYSERTRQGNRHFNADFKFDWDSMVVNTSWRNLNRHAENSYKTMPITEDCVDAVSLFYRLRNTDPATLRVGVPVPLNMVLRNSIRQTSYTFLGREVLNIPGVGRFNTFKFSVMLVTSGDETFQDGSRFYIWISDDLNRIPLQVQSPIRVGSVRIRLAGHSGLKHPLTSRIR
ncbi:MAG: DUF3108 domain-containing protein [Bacteroidales bacterium]|nr:DUF3108 domain-containing protein [Bacteroidales bacterium]